MLNVAQGTETLSSRAILKTFAMNYRATINEH